MCRRPLPTTAVQLLLFCFFSALLLLLPSQGNALWCGYGQRTESKVLIPRIQHECKSEHIGCNFINCSSGKQQWFGWGCSRIITKENTNCTSRSIELATKRFRSTEKWTCDCSFGELGESVDLAPPDLPSTTTTTTTKRSRTTKSGGGKKSGGGRLIVKTHLVIAFQMFIGIMPAVFVGLRSRTA
uniref:Secreted protein n=1 Tax=Globodera rostochiensis TaxID=31243 RepID=A0A914HHU4_GLORO